MTESNVLLANEANFATAGVVRFARIWSVFLLYQQEFVDVSNPQSQGPHFREARGPFDYTRKYLDCKER